VDRDRTGLLIIRAWVEPGSDQTLRAHMRVTSDVANGFERMETFSDAGAVEKAVTSWLAEVVTI
jgi:hypothetical protein